MDSQVVIGAFARHLLTTLGGILVSKGLLESSQVEPLAGAVLVIGGVVWSLIQKKRAAAK
jgi:hypothetical protein